MTGDDDLHRLSLTVLMTPDMSNFSGNVHGGQPVDQVPAPAPAGAAVPVP